MDKIYNVSFRGTFYGEARVTASNKEEAYEIASELADYFDINVATYEYDAGGSVEETTIESIEEEDLDYEEDYEEDM